MSFQVAENIELVHSVADHYGLDYGDEYEFDDDAPMTDDDIRDVYYDENEHVFALSVFDPNWGVWRDV